MGGAGAQPLAFLDPVFLDTSVLLEGLIETGLRSRPAQDTMEAIAQGGIQRPQTAWHCCLEFFAVTTRLPEELRLSPSEACRLIEEEILARFEVCQLPAGERLRFIRASVAERAAGGRIYDAHISEIARLAGARMILTENTRHFAELGRHGIQVLRAVEFADQFLK